MRTSSKQSAEMLAKVGSAFEIAAWQMLDILRQTRTFLSR
jgi:hypothetical protein